jgi:adenosylhomocysteine nucleosidase
VIAAGIAVALKRERKTLTAQEIPAGKAVRLPDGTFVALAGPGRERARAAGQALFAAGARALVSFGVAAGLDPGFPPGALVLPEEVVATDGTRHRVDGAWRARLRRRVVDALDVRAGLLAEAAAVLAGPAEKRGLFERFGAGAADMESAGLASLARERKVPFLVIRAIADPADVRVPPWVAGVLDSTGGVRSVALVLRLLTRPADMPALLALGRHFAAACRTLRRVVALAGTSVTAAGD